MPDDVMTLLKREAILLAVLAAFGVIALPFGVYVVGAQIIGEYRSGANALSLPIDVWAALGRGHWAAWLLVASPYVVIQALRLALALWRARKPVTHVTDPAPETRNWRV